MKRYRVVGQMTITVMTEVKASSKREAREIARNRDVMGPCHHCASADASEKWVTSGELDGTPRPLPFASETFEIDDEGERA
jgi:hypothetical protein